MRRARAPPYGKSATSLGNAVNKGGKCSAHEILTQQAQDEQLSRL
jgi:hypothetical protein